MDEEIVDIVDKADKVIGKISKVEAYKNGILHRCAIAKIIES